MNKLDLDYQNLLKDILENGTKKETRNGGTISVFGRQIRHKMSEGFPLLTTKKMPFKTIVTELLWFLRGDTNIKYLVDNGCHIWDGDAYKKYIDFIDARWQNSDVGDLDDFIHDGHLISGYNEKNEWYARIPTKEEFAERIKTDNEFAKKWGELGPIYGKQWRKWKTYTYKKTEKTFEDISSPTSPFGVYGTEDLYISKYIDQIANLINDLKTNPDSRRLMVNAWNVGEIDQMVLPPCHYGFQVYTRELKPQERMDWLNKKNNTDERYRMVTMDDLNVPKRAISLMWNQRSVDTFLGLPFNIASYGLLLEIIAKEVNMVPDELIGNLGDVHLYSNHIEQAKEQIGRELTLEERYGLCEDKTGKSPLKNKVFIDLSDDLLKSIINWLSSENIPTRTREPYPLPRLDIKLHFNNQPSFTPEHWLLDDFVIEDYQSHPTIKAPLSN